MRKRHVLGVSEEHGLVVHGGNQRGRLFDKGSGKGMSRSKVGRKGVQCYHCKEYGHIKRDCLKCDDQADNGTTNMAVAITDEREYFDMFQETRAGVVCLGDGSTCDVTGVGTVKIKMIDGVVRTLGGVAYVPKLRKNPVSLGQLDSSCRWSHENHTWLYDSDEGREAWRIISSGRGHND
ncbi:uncharacterized protein LOC143859002 [Tasmannia lanceolata]|uniref:uncharacterized protein LOC143859002 n=1 Tax=Tasmannia lanceolata TaxID=3420 RepID=UPI004063FEBF